MESMMNTRKKTAIILLAFFLMPLSLWAMTPVSDTDLSTVTGQSGVSINADVTMNIGIGTLAWGDADGISKYWPTAGLNGAGYFGVSGFNLTNLRIKARETDHYGTGYGTVYSGSYGTAYLKPITIDVGYDPSYVTYNGATFVRIGLGSLQVSLDALSLRVGLGPDTSLAQEVGTLNLGPMAAYFNPASYIDLYNPRIGVTSAVYVTMNVIVDQFDLSYLSWGDSDGLPGGNTGTGGVVWMAPGTLSTAGYLGLQNLTIGGPVTLTGTVSFDVTTSRGGVYASAGGGQVTVFHIIFQRLTTLNFHGPITANVRLDSVAALNSANAGTLGNIYLSGVNLDVRAGSWIDIWAH